MRRLLLSVLVLSAVLGCNRRVFVEVPPTCDTTIATDLAVPTEKAADILIVVDNSRSMGEEQESLAAAFIRDDGSCPINSADLKDFARCGDANPPDVCRFANPTSEMLEAPGPDGLKDCGFIQVLAAYENDYRIGVITTDVGLCDNRLPALGAPEGWGHHPQRGCLQPNGPEGTTQKVIARQDLLDGDSDNDDIAARFSATLANISIYGSSFERGLDAAELFLDPETERDERCSTDLDSFVRPNARLVVIFLTDEEDCSRNADVAPLPANGTCASESGCDLFVCSDDCEVGRSEFAGERCGTGESEFRGAGACYDNESWLTPPAYYASRLAAFKGGAPVDVAVIAGGVPDEAGNIVESNCIFKNDAASSDCGEVRGVPGNCEAGRECCVADGGGRYFELADQLGGLKNTICVDNFNQTMVNIAVKVGDVATLSLAEEPADLSLIIVEKAPVGSSDYVVVPRLFDIDECPDGADGWYLDGSDNLTVRFCGNARPVGGERVRVRAKGDSADPAGGPSACVTRDQNADVDE